MVDTREPRKLAFLGSEYNEFLFASIGTDARGRSLTVVSALARLDLDPWSEAAKLARLPGAIAAQKLAELIPRFPEIQSVPQDSGKIAAQLTALLPGRTCAALPIRRAQPRARAMADPQSALSAFFIGFALVVGMQLIVSELHYVRHATTPAGSPHSIASNSSVSRPPLFGGPRIPVLGN